MALLNDEMREQLSGFFEGMKEDVTIGLFTHKESCETCEETESFMQEMETLSEKIHLEAYDLDTHQDKAKEYDITLTPSIVLLDGEKKHRGIKFNGIPAGHEVNSFIKGIMEVSGALDSLPESLQARLDKITKPVNIKVFVTLSCPHCPGAVEKAHKLALENPHIDAEMIEAQTFGEVSNKFNVSSVPKVVINDEFEFVGNQPLDTFLDEIEKTQ
ncbi:protein disulfide oxidoreductase [Isachenkonia alkalipeptolytica]|uniref:Glutaredoxin n=1 Tax=Isachenkonia alkalipeptolytica TaxID=2565777 RepID=A0AA43XLZ0_9CLOT|nr:thioredoxin family protein [Isachenkonia alkalipeptolytica]NBG88370.1 glutaredoxin [Isachenkonia alkalipeptolytica]